MTKIRTRKEWGAVVDLSRHLMPLPADGVFIHHSATTVSDNSDLDIRRVEQIGYERFGIMSYSYLTHPRNPGIIYEGAGLTKGAHTANHNSRFFGINFVGNYSNDSLTVTQVDDVVWLIRHLIATGNLKPNPQIHWHSEVKQTACPGENVRRIIPHIANRILLPEPPKENYGTMVDVTATMPVLAQGAKGKHVAVLQSILNIKADQRITVDGVFGPSTHTAVVNVQRFFNLTASPDGICGPKTWATLLSI